MTLEAELQRNSAMIEQELESILPAAAAPQGRLHEAMRYAALGGGKRLRAFLVVQTGSLLEADMAACRRVAAALELVHAYSLIHDDLPAMDDASLRRGKTTCHLAFDDATAVLAGDALQTLAFQTLAENTSPVMASARAPLCADLAVAAGAAGMCGGQMLDLNGEKELQNLDEVLLTQRLKTGALFNFACTAACHLAKDGQSARPALGDFAAAFGLAFQIRDDILDLTGDPSMVGKDLGRDQEAGKSTVVSHLGLEAAQTKLDELRQQANDALDRLPGDTSLLRELMGVSINRKS